MFLWPERSLILCSFDRRVVKWDVDAFSHSRQVGYDNVRRNIVFLSADWLDHTMQGLEERSKELSPNPSQNGLHPMTVWFVKSVVTILSQRERSCATKTVFDLSVNH